MATALQAEILKKKRRDELLEMTNKGYTPEFIKYAYWRLGKDTTTIDTELQQLMEFSGVTDPNQVQVGERKFNIKTMADEKAYQDIQAGAKKDIEMKDTARTELQKKLDSIQSLADDKEGLAAAVGTNIIGRLPTPMTGAKQRFVGAADQILATDTLNALINAKSQGATFGALSEGELNILRSSATKIGQWAIRDKDGKVTGFNVGESDFIKELDNLKQLTAKALGKIGGTETAQAAVDQSRQPVQTMQQPQQTQQYKLNGQTMDINQVQEWIRANPNDPKAAQVKAKLEGSGILSTAPATGESFAGKIPTGTQAPPPEQPKEERPLVKKIGDFLGITKFGEGIGTAMFLKTKEGKDLQKKAEQGDKYAIEALQQILDEAPDAKELIGSAAMTALNVASAGVAGQATLGVKIAAGAATGYGFDVASNLQDEEGGDFKPGVGTVVGGAIPILGAVKNWVAGGTKGVAERVMNSVVKPGIDDLKKAILYNGKTLGKEMLDEGLKGTKWTLVQKAEKGLVENETKLQNILSDSTATIKKEELLPYLTKLKDKLMKTPTARAQKALQTVDSAIQLFPDEFNLSQANELKRNLYSELRDLAYKIDPNLTPTSEASKALAGGLKDLIEKKAASPAVSAINKKLSTFMKVQEGMLDQLARTQRNNLAPISIFGFIERTLGTTAIKTYGAAVINKAAKILEATGEGVGGRITKAMILNAIEKAKRDANRR